MLTQLWTWWSKGEAPGAAIQQVCFILFTAVATWVGLYNLSAWKRQQLATTHASAAKDVIDSAALVCEQILIERLSTAPMVVFSDLNNVDREFHKLASSRIDKEQAHWIEQKQKLAARVSNFRASVVRNAHILGSAVTINSKLVVDLLAQVNRYTAAIDDRIQTILRSREASSREGYQPLVSIATLSRNHPLLLRKERNLVSSQFEEAMRRAMDSLRAGIPKGP